MKDGGLDPVMIERNVNRIVEEERRACSSTRSTSFSMPSCSRSSAPSGSEHESTVVRTLRERVRSDDDAAAGARGV